MKFCKVVYFKGSNLLEGLGLLLIFDDYCDFNENKYIIKISNKLKYIIVGVTV